MGFSKFSKSRRKFVHDEQEREIQITPFVDIVLVLLIVFMISSPAVLSGIEVNLPNGSEKTENENSEDNFLTLTLSADGKLYLGDEVVSVSTIIPNIRNKFGNVKEKTIFIRGDKMNKYGDIMNIIDILNRAGYKQTILVTNPNM